MPVTIESVARQLIASVDSDAGYLLGAQWIIKRYEQLAIKAKLRHLRQVGQVSTPAAITTGAAIRARPVVPIMVSSLVVVFSVIELLLLPLAAILVQSRRRLGVLLVRGHVELGYRVLPRHAGGLGGRRPHQPGVRAVGGLGADPGRLRR